MKLYTENVPRSKYAELIEKSYRNRKSLNFGSSFYFVYDMIRVSYIYLDKEFYDVTGYPPSLIVRGKIDFIDKHIHPDDLMPYHKIRAQWMEVLENHFRKNREHIKLSFDFRLLNSEGASIRLLYQTLHIEFNCSGKMLYIIGKCSDISHWNKSNDMVLSITSSHGTKNFHFPSTPASGTRNYKFSLIERKIIRLLAEGCNSKVIADEMAITFNTANTHRRKMLRKAKVRNTSELVYFAYNHQLI